MRGDVSAFLEACYQRVRDDRGWASDAVVTFREAFPWFDEVGMYIADCDPATDTVTAKVVVVPPRWSPLVEGVRITSLRANRHILYRESIVMTVATARVGEGVGISVHPTPTTALIVHGVGGPARLAHQARTVLTRAALHLESGFRMRLRRGAVRAVISAEGELLDGALAPNERATFARAARGAEAARSTRDLGSWTALVAGHITLVPRLRGARRVYELVENARAARRVRALSRRELDVLELASTGLSTALCGYALGLSPTTISTTLTSAARKLGTLGALELLRVAAVLAHDPRADADEATLAAAEREILALVGQGLRRGRPVRTIADEVASLLDQTGHPSRRPAVAASGTSAATRAAISMTAPSTTPSS
jgi:DNA-binding CsgD family transcriptional regulator